ncbi:hypothetical protein ACLOJK_009401 [Asimina triloba]
MEVTISETFVVYPSRYPLIQNPDEGLVLALSHLDNDRNLHVTVRTLRVYSNHSPPPADPVHLISQALSKALVHYYPLAGTLRPRSSDNRLELFCAGGQGVTVIRATADRTLASLNYLDEPGSAHLERLVPDPHSGEELNHPFILQITVFACGGFSLGMCVHHSLCDGLGATQFLSAVAGFASGAAEPSEEPVWDRALLLRPRNPPRVEFPFHEFLSLDKQSTPYSAPAHPITRECYDVRNACVERFKRRLMEESGLSFTTFEALGAFIWRARVKAAGVEGKEKVKFAYFTNIRKQVKPALPAGYWGNGCVPMYVQTTAAELVEMPVWVAADMIKKSKRQMTDEYVRSFIDFQEIHYAEGIAAGAHVSGFTDWRHLGHSGVDFGWGGPISVQPLSWRLLGSAEPCFLLPCSSANEGGMRDGFKVLVSLPAEAGPAFKEEMEMLSGKQSLL